MDLIATSPAITPPIPQSAEAVGVPGAFLALLSGLIGAPTEAPAAPMPGVPAAPASIAMPAALTVALPVDASDAPAASLDVESTEAEEQAASPDMPAPVSVDGTMPAVQPPLVLRLAPHFTEPTIEHRAPATAPTPVDASIGPELAIAAPPMPAKVSDPAPAMPGTTEAASEAATRAVAAPTAPLTTTPPRAPREVGTTDPAPAAQQATPVMPAIPPSSTPRPAQGAKHQPAKGSAEPSQVTVGAAVEQTVAKAEAVPPTQAPEPVAQPALPLRSLAGPVATEPMRDPPPSAAASAVEARALPPDAAPPPPPAAPDPAPPASAPRATAVAWPARQVAPFLVSVALGGDSRLSVTLDPIELGRVEVAIERHGGEAHVSLRAERPETLALLQRDRAELERALTSAGFGSGDQGASLSFSLGGDSSGRRDRRQDPPATPAVRISSSPAADAQHGEARGLLDLAV